MNLVGAQESGNWTYGAEHEWADFDKKADLQGAAEHNFKDHTIVNSNGVANDASGKLYGFGGEINIKPTDLEGQVACLGRLRAILPDAAVNYRSNLHIHVRVPGLREDLTKLKRIQKYIHDHMPKLFPVIQPIEKPLPGGVEPDAYAGAVKRYKRTLVSHHRLLPKKRLEAQRAAQSVEEFFKRAVPADPDTGKALRHLQPRVCVNLDQLLDTDTIEFRHFFGTLDSGLLRTCLEYCRDFLESALEDAPVNDLIEKYRGVEFPKCPRYDHRLEIGYQATCHGNSREDIERNIKLILDGRFDESSAGDPKPPPPDNAAPTFTKSIDAARQLRDAQGRYWAAIWALAYALLEECGRPGEPGFHTGSDDLLRKAKSALKRAGFDYSFEYLRELRRVAAAFGAGDRSPTASWTVHVAAGDPDTLKAAQKEAEREGAKLTVSFVKRFIAARRGNDKRPPDGRVIVDKFRAAVADVKAAKPHLSEAQQLEVFEAATEVMKAFEPPAEQYREAAE